MINNQKSKLYVVLITLATTLCVPKAMAFSFGNLMGTMGGGNADATADDPNSFVQSAKSVEKLMDKSTTLLVHYLANKESVDTIEAEKKAANEVTDLAERQAKLAEVKKSEQTVLNETLSNDEFKAKIQKMDGKQKKELGAAAFNFALALLREKALVEQSKTLISSMSSNPATQPNLGSVKEATSGVSNQVSSASTIADKMPDIFSAVGMRGPVSKDEKPKITTAVSGN